MEASEILAKLKAGSLSVGEEGHLLMELEAALRREAGLPIEINLAPRKDDNKLRLQTLEKIVDHKRRQEELKHSLPGYGSDNLDITEKWARREEIDDASH